MKKISTVLQDRVLRFDGVSIVPPEAVARCLLLGVQPSELRVSEEDWEINQFNLNVPDELTIKVDAPEPVNLSFQWQLPEPFHGWSEDDLERFIAIQFELNCPSDYTQEQYDAATVRLGAELEEIKRRGMVEFMKTICYVLSVFREKGAVWGVGRGSSCASYILFVLGLHAVDCIRLDVPMEEFYHD